MSQEHFPRRIYKEHRLSSHKVEYFTKWEGHRTLLAGVEDTVNISYHLYYSLGSPPGPVPITFNI